MKVVLRLWVRVVVVTLACTALACFTVGPGIGAGGSQIVVALREAVEFLPVRAEVREGYGRDRFEHWIDVDGDGCSTRAEVLLVEAVEPPDVTGRCELSGGRWYSFVDDAYVDGPRGLDVDHMVPLAEAWDSGAYGWTPQRRRDYANDLAEDAALVAVTARANRSKADKDPREWLPPFAPAVCRYLMAWVVVKLRWHLSVDRLERDVLVAKAAECPDEVVTVVPAW